MIIIASCVRENSVTSCIVYNNNSPFSIVIEVYRKDSNNDGLRDLRETISSNNFGMFYNQCTNNFSVMPPGLFFESDSIVVKFDNQRFFTSTSSEFGSNPTGLLNRNNYVVEGTTYTYTFTQQDYDNAEPY